MYADMLLCSTVCDPGRGFEEISEMVSPNKKYLKCYVVYSAFSKLKCIFLKGRKYLRKYGVYV